MSQVWKPSSGLTDSSVPIGSTASVRIPAATFPPLTRRPAANRVQQLLELASQALGASHGGIGVLSSENELVEHVYHKDSPQGALDPQSASWTRAAVRFVVGR